MPGCSRVLLAVAWLAAAGVARAEEAPGPAAAQRHFEAGMASYHLEDYERAIAEWEAGYRAKPVPQFLFNLGQAHRLAKHHDKALSMYRRYLRLDPEAPNRAEVQKHIEELESLVKNAPPAPVTPSPAPVTPGPAPVTPSPAPVTAEAKTSTTTATAALTASAPPKRDVPLHKKRWFWGVVAGGAALVAGAVTVGVVVGTRDREQALPVVQF